MHENLVCYKLHKILVTANDTALQTLRLRHQCQCTDNIVSFVTLNLQAGYVHGFYQVPHRGQLLTKFIRHLFPGCLVFRIHLVAKCFLFAIKNSRKIIGRFISQ